MGWMRYLVHDFWTASELDRIDREMYARRRTEQRGRIELRQRVEELEDDLGRVALLARALAEACLQKGILTRNEVAAMASKVDLADGVQDGQLDPRRLSPPLDGPDKG